MSYTFKIFAQVRVEKCQGHRKCKAAMVCPSGAISQNKEDLKRIVINAEKCIGCGKCLKACPDEAIILKKIMLE